jgi:PTS system ascorbate-specific IIA component
MVAVVVVAHAPLASALVAAARHVYSRNAGSPCECLAAIDIQPDTSVASAETAVRAVIQDLNRCCPEVLVLTDLPGATPANVAGRLQDLGRVAVLAGVNLPMVLRSLCYRHLPLDDVFNKAREGGQNGIVPLTAT